MSEQKCDCGIKQQGHTGQHLAGCPASEKPRVYYAVWEDATLNDDDSVDESGFCSGAISTHGGGNLHWDDNQFQVVHKDDYDALKLENERLKKALLGDCETEHLKVEQERDRALAENEKLKADIEAFYQSSAAGWMIKYNRTFTMLKKMAGAIEEFDAANIVGDFNPRDRKSKEAQRWRDRWEAARENLTAVAELYRKEFGDKNDVK